MTTMDAIVKFIANLCIYASIPLLWWAITQRKKSGSENFFRYVGLKKPVLQKPIWVLLIFLILFWLDYSWDRSILVSAPAALAGAADQLQNTPFYNMGWGGVLPAFILNMGANGLCEELLFRGFILKRLAKKFGTNAAIIISAVLFGLMHNVLYIIAGAEVSFMYHLIILFGGTFTGALLFGYANEKLFKGSIWPSVLLHGLGNFYNTWFMLFPR